VCFKGFLLNGLKSATNAGGLAGHLFLFDSNFLRPLIILFDLAESGFCLSFFTDLLLEFSHLDLLPFFFLFLFDLLEGFLLLLLGS
jgi:hypothetical protein